MFYWNVLYVCPALTELASSACEVMSRLDNYFPHASGIACMCMFYWYVLYVCPALTELASV